MLKLFYMGGSLFMGMLTLIFIAMISVAVINGMPLLRGGYENLTEASRKLKYIKSVGLFALVVGLLGQLIGLFSAVKAIELGTVGVSPTIMAGGFKVSMITTLYGLTIYAVSLFIWLGLSFFSSRN
ncbi:MAG: MotA/TolQ/ExbB proton channel family protein [Bacteroidota bacterium]